MTTCPLCAGPVRRSRRNRLECQACGAHWTARELARDGRRDRRDPYRGRVNGGYVEPVVRRKAVTG